MPTDPRRRLRIDKSADGVFHLSGDLDLTGAPRLRTSLQQAIATGAEGLILDVAELTFCDTTGLTVFVTIDQALPARLILRHPTYQLRQLLHVTSLDRELCLQ
jgi:anti-sigma B factor antagonist